VTKEEENQIDKEIELTCALVPKTLPPQWGVLEDNVGGLNFVQKQNGLRVIFRAELHAGECWLHVSMSFPDKLPTYEHMKSVKNVFIGRKNKAIQVFAPEDEHVNIHSFVLHLWAPVDRDPLPDFRRPSDFVKGLGV